MDAIAMDVIVAGYQIQQRNADFVILEENILEIPLERIHEVKVCETVMDGKTTYRA